MRHDAIDDDAPAALAGVDVQTTWAPLLVEALPIAGLALQHVGVPLVASVTLINPTDDDWADLTLSLTVEPAFAEAATLRLSHLAAGTSHTFERPALALAPGFLAAQDERTEGRLIVTAATPERQVARTVAPVSVLPPAHWPGGWVLPELLAAWVRPNSKALPPLLRDAADRLARATERASLDGYQSRDPRRVWATAKALYEALQARGVKYINPPASFEQSGQKVRTPTQVIDEGLGTCLDLAVVLAALLEQCGLNAFVVLVAGHAFPGVWLTDFSLHEPVHDDPLPLRKRVDLGEALVFDSSPVTEGVPFDEARRGAEAMLRATDTFRYVVDVAAARRWGTRPLPGDGGEALASEAPRAADAPAEDEAAPPDRWLADRPEAAASARTRLDRWAGRLLDLTLRNRLLNLRPGKRFVDLRFVDGALIERGLAGGEVFELLPRPAPSRIAGEGLSAEALEARREEQARALAAEGLPSGRLLTDHPPADLDARLLELYRRARTTLLDTGTVTLYLGVGLLRWREADDVPRDAPLVLVPVQLERPPRGAPWRLKAADEETRINVTLLHKLRQVLGLDTASLEVTPTDGAGVDVPLIVRRFRALVRDVAGLEVIDTAFLAEFSFTKFLMWLDLEAKRDALLANPVVRHLFDPAEGGFPLEAPLVTEDALDAARGAADSATVMEADPSQLQAVLAAADGSSFVLQGPPGTGKSQTIANLIAHVLGAGRTVLFVSEKMAALDVVQRRLERVGLGPFCLELHAHQASRRGVVEQLKTSFAHAERQAPADWEALTDALDAARDVLNAHAARLRAPTPFGETTRGVLASMFGGDGPAAIDLPGLDFGALDAAQVEAARAACGQAAVALADVGSLFEHPWRAARATSWTPGWAREVTTAVRALGAATEALDAAARRAADILHLPGPPATPAELDDVVGVAERLVTTPAPPAALVAPDDHRARLERLRAWAERGAQVAAERAALRATWRDDLLAEDLDGLHARYARWAQAFFLLAFVMLWSARRALGRVAQGRLPGATAVRDDLARARALRADLAEVQSWDADARAWLGARWAGADTDWAAVRGLCDWTEAQHRTLLAWSEAADRGAALARVRELATARAELVQPGARCTTSCRRWAPRGRPGRRRAIAWLRCWIWIARRPGARRPRRPRCCAGGRRRGRRRAAAPVVRRRRRDPVAARGGAGRVAERALDGDVAPADLEAVAERSLRAGWWDAHLDAEPALAGFRGLTHDALIERFRALDQQVIARAREATAARLAARVPPLHGPGDELALLRRQMQLKARHMPIRQLFGRVPTLLRRLKPCALMSPLSVAQFLDPTLEGFDVVVFDEASQIPPWDAVGAIARGRQVIIVGDSKQLPPTTFFDRGGDEEAEQIDDEDLEETESILDEAVAAGLPTLRLGWHYRSRHESLIAFSNRHYYDGELHSFPSADDALRGRGLEWAPVPDGFYDRGGSRTNRGEAEAVVAEIRRLAALPESERPTVGVVTFSVPQQRLIEDLLDEAAAAEPALAAWLTEGDDEPLFVKNLESVQGDERDVMLFSVGYGPDASGRVTMNFGPLNRQGGERRLNVAITRARERLVVFSTLRPTQIDLARTRALGVRHLRDFLAFAEAQTPSMDGAEGVAARPTRAETAFEAEVSRFLTDLGHVVHPRVGRAGYRVDLAVGDPARPGAYVLAITCDGPTYHDCAVARARDRLREAVLESLGWRTCRVWATDWWYERPKAEARLKAAVDAALAAASAPVFEMPAPRIAASAAASIDVDAALAAGAPAQMPDLPADCAPWPGLPAITGGAKEAFYEDASTARLRADLARIAHRVGPVQREAAYRHVVQAWGFGSLGRRIVERLDAVVEAAADPHVADDALWPDPGAPDAWTAFRPGAPDGPARAADELPVAEVANAARWIVEQGVSMSRDAAVVALAQLFGFGRAGAKVRRRMEAGIDRAAARGAVALDGDRLRVPR
ncbi:MAG: DUF4011 domain-containing protein [Myxococcales bacterium]|nr:DUF4011 domain-containing protein [Myxococcales bacterium]